MSVGAAKVLYVINGFQRGGAEQGLLHLLRGGAFEGCDVTIAALAGGDAGMIAALEAGGASVRLLSPRERMSPASLALALPKLAALAWRLRPAVTILSLPQANICGRLASLIAPLGVVASFEHNTHLAKRVYETGYRATSRQVRWLIADCETTAREAEARLYRHAPDDRIVLPLVSFDPPRRRAGGPVAGPLRLVNAARFTAVKNQAALIQAVALLAKRGVEVELTLLGEGPERAACRELASALAVSERVRFPGFVQDWSASGDYDAFVLSSRHEGLCIVALEAMSRGLAVIAPAIGGIRDYGSDAVMRVVADVEPQTLADAIATLDADRSRLAALAAAGQTMATERYGREAVGATYRAFAARLRAEASGARI